MLKFVTRKEAQLPSRILDTAERAASVVAVSVYLFSVGCLLLASGRIRIDYMRLARAVLTSFRRPFNPELREMTHESGHCYAGVLGRRLISDMDGQSRLKLLEDGEALPYPHSKHDDIRDLGNGRYSHWGDVVYFSSSDNTDPLTNGRRYSVSEV
jgi:hypothetical protein